jgi:hypothetical protein
MLLPPRRKRLSEAFSLLEKGMAILAEDERILERGKKRCRGLSDLLRCCNEQYYEKKEQTLVSLPSLASSIVNNM